MKKWPLNTNFKNRDNGQSVLNKGKVLYSFFSPLVRYGFTKATIRNF